MKKMLAILVVLLLAFAMVIPAAAGNGPGGSGKGSGSGTGQGQQGSRGIFAITGTITALGSNTVSINVNRGNKLVQPYLGTELTVTVTSRTRYLYKDGTTTSVIGFADLKVGQPVSVHGRVADEIWTTSRITVGASLSCLNLR
jgi:hypothetical protein